MVPFTRRRVLQGAVGALGALAGCNDLTDGRAGDATPTPRAGPSGSVVRSPDHVSLRGSEGPPAWFDDPRRGETPTAVGPDEGRQRGLIASEDVAATLSFADGVAATTRRTDGSAERTPADGVDAARAFVEATDFEAETLYLDGRRLGECYRMDLCYVSWSPADLETQYGRVLRDHDARCRADADDAMAFLIRIPAALDPGERTGFGSGVHGGSCEEIPSERGGPTPRSRAGTTTDGATDGGGG